MNHYEVVNLSKMINMQNGHFLDDYKLQRVVNLLALIYLYFIRNESCSPIIPVLMTVSNHKYSFTN